MTQVREGLVVHCFKRVVGVGLKEVFILLSQDFRVRDDRRLIGGVEEGVAGNVS